MVLKPDGWIRRAQSRFENDVKKYGTQTSKTLREAPPSLRMM